MSGANIYEIEVSELETRLLMTPLNGSELESMPFDGEVPSKNAEEAKDRILWTLNTCITNIGSVKQEIQERYGDNPVKSVSIILSIYQSCVFLNPAIDTVMWEFSNRQKGLYHDLFSAPPLNDHMPSVMDSTGLNDVELFSFDEDMPIIQFDIPPWMSDMGMSKSLAKSSDNPADIPVPKNKKIQKKDILTLEAYLKKNLIGQDEAIEQVVKTLKRSIAGLKDDSRPIGVFLLAGSSGVGKSQMAKLIQSHLFGDKSKVVRVDCGEYQQKHDSMKLIGSPNSYTGYEDGGQLTNAVREAENTVLLLDEAEKAHPDFWNVFLKVFDEGFLTANDGEDVSFENTIIFMTSNLGNDKIAQKAFGKGVGFHNSIDDQYDSSIIPSREVMAKDTREAINKFFKPEFVNRIDDIILFNYLKPDDLERIAQLELKILARKLSKQNIILKWTKTAEKALALNSQKTIQGARAIAKTRRTEIEDMVTDSILSEECGKNCIIELTARKKPDGYKFVMNVKEPISATPQVHKNERDG